MIYFFQFIIFGTEYDTIYSMNIITKGISEQFIIARWDFPAHFLSCEIF